MTFKGKGKALCIFGIFILILVFFLFFADKEEEVEMIEVQKEAEEIRQIHEDLKYLKAYAWYTERENDRYWFIFSPQGYPDEGENGSVTSFVEHTDIEMTEDDFNGRFTDIVCYDEIKLEENVMTFTGEAGILENRYRIEKDAGQLIFSSVDVNNQGSVIYRAADVDEIIYPVYTYGQYRGM